jgi:DUF1365 family protein
MAVFHLDLDELDLVQGRVHGFGVNRRTLVAFDDRDHCDGSAQPTKPKILAFLRTHGIELEGGTVSVLTQCRMFGYVFNPVSFYFCRDRDDGLRCVVAEVNNTFGERHMYLLSDDNRLRHSDAATRDRYTVRKSMHVSPFVSMQATYEFAFHALGERLSLHIREYERGEHFFDAHLWGRRLELTSGNLARVLVRFPFFTLKIIAAIHWQALRLYAKGAPFFRQPPPSADQVAHARLWQRLGKEHAG